MSARFFFLSILFLFHLFVSSSSVPDFESIPPSPPIVILNQEEQAPVEHFVHHAHVNPDHSAPFIDSSNHQENGNQMKMQNEAKLQENVQKQEERRVKEDMGLKKEKKQGNNAEVGAKNVENSSETKANSVVLFNSEFVKGVQTSIKNIEAKIATTAMMKKLDGDIAVVKRDLASVIETLILKQEKLSMPSDKSSLSSEKVEPTDELTGYLEKVLTQSQSALAKEVLALQNDLIEIKTMLKKVLESQAADHALLKNLASSNPNTSFSFARYFMQQRKRLSEFINNLFLNATVDSVIESSKNIVEDFIDNSYYFAEKSNQCLHDHFLPKMNEQISLFSKVLDINGIPFAPAVAQYSIITCVAICTFFGLILAFKMASFILHVFCGKRQTKSKVLKKE